MSKRVPKILLNYPKLGIRIYLRGPAYRLVSWLGHFIRFISQVARISSPFLVSLLLRFYVFTAALDFFPALQPIVLQAVRSAFEVSVVYVGYLRNCNTLLEAVGLTPRQADVLISFWLSALFCVLSLI